MKLLNKVLFSYTFITILLVILGAGAGVATFIENDFDTQTAKVLVYDALWYEIVMLLLAISLLGIIVKTKMYKKPGIFLFHLGFVFVLVGAFITRYFGYEGMFHVREGQMDNRVISEQSYFLIELPSGEPIRHPLRLGRIGNNHFKYTQEYNNKDVTIEYKKYIFSKNGSIKSLIVDVNYDGQTQEVKIIGGHGSYEKPVKVKFGEDEFGFAWGSKLIYLPFEIKLKDFQLERYPGSESASSFASEVVLIDKTAQVDYRIFMNHPLTYDGFKFFQSSYDQDEKGTVLSVNKDPGKWPTYIAYGMLIVGFVINFFLKGTRFARLRRFLRETNMAFILSLIVLFSTSTNLFANEDENYFNSFKANSLNHANELATLFVQDYNGRIKPMHTEARDILNKMSQSESMLGLTPTQIILGVISNPTYWETKALVKINNKEIKAILGLQESQKYIAFNDVFDKEGKYKLQKQIDKANGTDPAKRSKFDNDLIKFDERLNIFYLITQGMFTKFIPKKDDENNKWFDPQNTIYESWINPNVKEAIYNYFDGLYEGVNENNWEKANNSLKVFKQYQQEVSSEILPSQGQVEAEIFLNGINIFKNLMNVYFILGLIVLIFALISIFLSKESKILRNSFYTLLIIGFLIHTAALGLRWYISGHAPWSDTYESLIYISWSAIFAGVVVFRKSMLSLSSSFILGAIALFVANLTFLSPQITPLVPVLKSYWLSIHVSVITASYGFLALGALLAFISLILMIFKTKNNEEKINFQIRQLIAIIEISLIAGLAMLTIGNFTGGIWANESWGRYWSWDPKETWTLVTMVVYTVVLHLRFVPKLNSVYLFLVSSLVSFASVIMTYFGVNYYLSGMHSYASGDKIPVPSFIYYLIVIVAVVSLLAFKGREVKRIV